MIGKQQKGYITNNLRSLIIFFKRLDIDYIHIGTCMGYGNSQQDILQTFNDSAMFIFYKYYTLYIYTQAV